MTESYFSLFLLDFAKFRMGRISSHTHIIHLFGGEHFPSCPHELL